MVDSSLHSVAENLTAENPDRLACRLIQRSYSRDGILEIAIGLSTLVVAGLMEAQQHLQRGSTAFKIVAVFLMLSIVLSVPAASRVAKWVRRHYLAGLEGHVVYKPLPRLTKTIVIGLSLILGAALGVLIPIGWKHLPSSNGWAVAGVGLWLAIFLPILGRSMRFTVMGILLAVVGILIGFSQMPVLAEWAIFCGFAGLMGILSGTAVLLRLVRRSIAEGGSDER